MTTFNKVYDGMNVMIRMATHAIERSMWRFVNNNDIELMIDRASEVLFDVATIGMTVSIVDETTRQTVVVGLDENKDHTIVVSIITVIDDRVRLPHNNNLVLNKDGSIELSGLLTGKMPPWLQ